MRPIVLCQRCGSRCFAERDEDLMGVSRRLVWKCLSCGRENSPPLQPLRLVRDRAHSLLPMDDEEDGDDAIDYLKRARHPEPPSPGA